MPNPVLTKAIDRLASRQDLSVDEAGEVLAEIMRGDATDVEIAAHSTRHEPARAIQDVERVVRRRPADRDGGPR